MKVKIEIECEDVNELFQHIAAIKKTIKKYSSTQLEMTDIDFEDNNCYGTHEVEIRNEE